MMSIDINQQLLAIYPGKFIFRIFSYGGGGHEQYIDEATNIFNNYEKFLSYLSSYVKDYLSFNYEYDPEHMEWHRFDNSEEQICSISFLLPDENPIERQFITFVFLGNLPENFIDEFYNLFEYHPN